MTDHEREPEALHQCRNYLAIVVSYADLLFGDLAEDDPRRKDVEEIREAGRAAAALLSEIAGLKEKDTK